MNEKVLEKLKEVRKYIQGKQYQEALDECEVMIMKNDKNFNAQMFAGFCYEKLGNDAKAEKAYLYAEDLDSSSIEVSKALFGIYGRLKKDQSTKYLQKLIKHYRSSDKTKYIQYFKKLIKIYEQRTDLELISKIFSEMKATETEIHEDFVAVAEAHFKVSVENECFQLNEFCEMGTNRRVSPECKEHVDRILLEIMWYLKRVTKDYQLKPEEMFSTIYYLRECFPDSSVILYLCLCDSYTVTHFETMPFIMGEIHLFLSAFYEKADNCYTNINLHNKEAFVVAMLLTYEYLRFLRQFFTVNEVTQVYITRLEQEQQALICQGMSEENQKLVSEFVLRQAVDIGNSIENPDVSTRLAEFRTVANKHGGFLEEVLARLAMNVFKDYKELNDMKNILKIRIANEPSNVFLMKYYYDYLIKIGKVFKVFDEEISIDDILSDIIRLDPSDYKYQIEQAWINFSKLVHEAAPEGIDDILSKLQGLLKEGKYSSKEEAVLLKKILIIKVHLNRVENIEEQLQRVIAVDPTNHQSLLSLGAFHLRNSRHEEGLVFLKRAFVIYQRDYHLNRLIYMGFMGVKDIKEAEYFTERIYAGFPGAFWTNYVLAISSMNRRNYDVAETYLTKSIQAFISSRERQYLVSYEKVHQRESLSSPYLILQNKYKILDESLIVPEEVMEKTCPLISNLYYKRGGLDQKEIRMRLQMGEILKILGRLASSLKSLKDVDAMCEELISKKEPSQVSQEEAFAVVLAKKELATVQFYYRNFKDSERILDQALYLQGKYSLSNLKNIEAEIYGLFFEISIEKLLTIMKTESYETIDSYINSFKIPESNYQSVVYMKCLYQLRILCYLHNQRNSQECLTAINQFLQSLGLDFNKVNSLEFSNTYYNLPSESKRLVKEVIQDLVVFAYISKHSHKNEVYELNKSQIIVLLQLFPDSSILYIMYGVMEENNEMKVGAFLKCVQIDQYNPVSIYFLANMYLKQGRYLPATKLYLKGIETNPFDMKSYYGLVLCLFSMSVKALAEGGQEEKHITECIVKVHSFLEYIKVVNPTVEYHFIDFLKMLLYEGELSVFEKKIKIQNGIKAYDQLKKLDRVVNNNLLEQLAKEVSTQNVWRVQGKQQLIQSFVRKYGNVKSTDQDMTPILLKKIEVLRSEAIQSRSVRHEVQYLLDQINLTLSIALKSEFSEKTSRSLLDLITMVVKSETSATQNLQRKLKSIKGSFFRYITRGSDSTQAILLKEFHKVLPKIQIHEQILADALRRGEETYRSKLNRLLLFEPHNLFLKERLEGVLLVKNRQILPKVVSVGKERLLLQANSPESKSHGYQKMMIYYNDQAAWILFIRANLGKDTSRQRLEYWLKVLSANQILQDPTHDMYASAAQLLAEVYVKYEDKHGKHEKYHKSIAENVAYSATYKRLHAEYDLYRNLTVETLDAALKTTADPTLLALNTLYQSVTTHVVAQPLLDVLSQLAPSIKAPHHFKYYQLLYYLACLHLQRNTKVTAFTKLTSFQKSTESLQSVDPSRLFIRISKNQLDRQFQQMDESLGVLAQFVLEDTEEKKLACYFDLMFLYHKVEAHPEDEDVIESFHAYIDHMREFGDVKLNSFLCYLSGMGILKTNRGVGVETPQQASLREFRKSILLNPSNGALILTKLS